MFMLLQTLLKNIPKTLSKLVLRLLLSVFIQPSGIHLLMSGCVFVLVFIQYDLILHAKFV